MDGRSHSSRDWLKQFWSGFSADIPKAWRVCGENLYAKHSIGYSALPSFFLGFSVWNERNICLPWDETLEWFQLLGITPVPVVYDGIFDEKKIRALWDPDRWESVEGYVLRVADEIPYGDFRKKIAKFVRKNHVQTVKHWMHGQAITKNLLRS